VSKSASTKAKAKKPAPKPAPKKTPSKPTPKKKPSAKPAAKKPAPKKPIPAKKPAKPAPKKSAPVKAPAKKPAPAPKPAAKAAASSPAKAKSLPVKPAPVAVPKTTAPAPAPAPVVPPVPALLKIIAPTPVPPPPKPAPKPSTKALPGKVNIPLFPSEPIAPAKPPVISTEKPAATKSGALYYDSHMHTPLCKHAWGEPEEYCAQGVKSGLKGIIFTCHCPMPDGFWQIVRMSESEFDLYVSLVQRAKAAYKNKLDVCLGIESEYFPGYEKYIEDLHKRADFDYCLGAVHWQAKEYLHRYEQGTIEGFRRTYFEHLAASAETGLYDCVAHPDLVKNYHPDSWCFAIIKNTVSTVLDRIAKTGVAMEMNTSGLNKSYSEMNPGNEMLRMMAERKIPIVLGSDSHRAPRVGEHFITALNNLSEAGFEEVSYFKKRQRIDLKISDVISSIRRAADANS
jgi:HisJ family histidinol phosphate phosphatase